MIKRMNHIVNCRTILRFAMACTQIQPHVSCFHFWAGFGIADALINQRYNQKVQINNKLANVLILPQIFVHALGNLAYNVNLI